MPVRRETNQADARQFVENNVKGLKAGEILMQRGRDSCLLLVTNKNRK